MAPGDAVVKRLARADGRSAPLTSLSAIFLHLESVPKVKEHVRIYWDWELEPCTEHRACDLEPATGQHHRGVLHLTF